MDDPDFDTLAVGDMLKLARAWKRFHAIVARTAESITVRRDDGMELEIARGTYLNLAAQARKGRYRGRTLRPGPDPAWEIKRIVNNTGARRAE